MKQLSPNAPFYFLLLTGILAVYYQLWLRQRKEDAVVYKLLQLFSALPARDKADKTMAMLEVLAPGDFRILESFALSIFRQAGFTLSGKYRHETLKDAYVMALDAQRGRYLIMVSPKKGQVDDGQLSEFSVLLKRHQAVAGYYVYPADPGLIGNTYYGYPMIRVLGIHQLVAMLQPSLVSIPN